MKCNFSGLPCIWYIIPKPFVLHYLKYILELVQMKKSPWTWFTISLYTILKCNSSYARGSITAPFPVPHACSVYSCQLSWHVLKYSGIILECFGMSFPPAAYFCQVFPQLHLLNKSYPDPHRHLNVSPHTCSGTLGPLPPFTLSFLENRLYTISIPYNLLIYFV